MHAPNACSAGSIRYNTTHAARAECVMGREVTDKYSSLQSVRRSCTRHVFGKSATYI